MTSDSLFHDLPEQMAPVSIMQAGVDPVWTEHKAKLIARYLRYFVCIPPPKAVCPDLLIGFKSMPYVMRYNHFPH